MLFLIGERARSKSTTLGSRLCAVCQSDQPFTEQIESLWFTLFGVPLLPIEDKARYWRCENCLNAYLPGQLSEPSQVAFVRRVIVYLLLGYSQQQHAKQAGEICLKVTGFELSQPAFRALLTELASGQVDMVETLLKAAPGLNAIGKQQIIEAAFLTTYVCCDLQYEDRLRINLMGNAMDAGLEFVDYAIGQARRQNYYGIRRLAHIESAI